MAAIKTIKNEIVFVQGNEIDWAEELNLRALNTSTMVFENCSGIKKFCIIMAHDVRDTKLEREIEKNADYVLYTPMFVKCGWAVIIE